MRKLPRMVNAGGIHMPGTGDSGQRYDFLDWLCVVAIFALVGWGWHLEWPMDILHRLRMPLLTLIVVIDCPWTRFLLILALTMPACFALYEGWVSRLVRGR